MTAALPHHLSEVTSMKILIPLALIAITSGDELRCSTEMNVSFGSAREPQLVGKAQ
jgi:hypothetical protein